MNQDYPHEIKPLAELTEEQKKHFAPLLGEEHLELEAKTPEERAAWLKERLLNSLDQRFEYARRKRD